MALHDHDEGRMHHERSKLSKALPHGHDPADSVDEGWLRALQASAA